MTVNGEPLELPAGSTVADVVRAACPSPKGVAVALDEAVVPRSSWAEVALAEGARLEVVTAAPGG
ncbi:MAG TPA: sulfur carrier protein ThiS [Acidimicrobiales bacterium]|nr:sulfur carrier protein ThiS [Acidimicrobiales bacterium]